MMLGMSMEMRQQISQRYKMVLAITMDPYLKLFEQFWDKRPKHKGTIPKELLAGSYEDIKATLPKYEGAKAEFLADVLGGATLFTDTGQIKGVLAATRDILPLEMQDDGLHYTVALTPTYGLVHKVPEQKWRGAISYEMVTRAPIPGEELDGNVGAVVAPATVLPDYSVQRTICPFLFTDFEVDDKIMRRNFRRITSARQIGRLLGGQEGEQQLEGLVGEFLGVSDDYREWVEGVAQKTPFKDLKELQERYEGVELKKYL
jgi:hypothetical protein